MSEIDHNVELARLLAAEPLLAKLDQATLNNLGQYLGSNFSVLRGIFGACKAKQPSYEYKPLIGAAVIAEFDYQQDKVTIQRAPLNLSLELNQLMRYLGVVDMVYAPLYPTGTVVELDKDLLPLKVMKIFEQGMFKPYLLITGRKIELKNPSYVIDYVGRIWPFGETPHQDPVIVSNVMISRVVYPGFKDEAEQTIAKTVHQGQLVNRQYSMAFMSESETKDMVKIIKEK